MYKRIMLLLCGMLCVVLMSGCEDTSNTERKGTFTNTSGISLGDAPTTAGANENSTVTFQLEVVNETGIDIYGLFASLTSADNWEENLLGNQGALYDGESMTVTFTIGTDETVFDWAIEDISGEMLEFYNLDFSRCSLDNVKLVFDENGKATLY